MDIKEIIKEFLDKELLKKLETPNNKDYDIYNEFSLQHELGIYIREKLGENYKVQFERNAKKLWGVFEKEKKWKKTEMDIFVYKKNNKKEVKDIDEIYAIELKFPRNKQYPEQMYSFIKDIKFMQQVKEKKHDARTFVLTIVDDPNFYTKLEPKKGDEEKDIYKYFRSKEINISSKDEIQAEEKIPAAEDIQKPTGKKDDITKLNKQLTQKIKWELISNNPTYRYYFMEI